jgi:hypothetical protein
MAGGDAADAVVGNADELDARSVEGGMVGTVCKSGERASTGRPAVSMVDAA